MIPPVLLISFSSIISKLNAFCVSFCLLYFSIIFILNFSILLFSNTVRMYASPVFISSNLATSIVFLFGNSFIYFPNIPLVVFSVIVPILLSYEILAFLLPTYPSLLFLIVVTLLVNKSPSLISTFLVWSDSRISWPSAPYILVTGSIYVNVPIPIILSFIYSPVLYKLLDKLNEPISTFNHNNKPKFILAKYKNDAGIIGATIEN